MLLYKKEAAIKGVLWKKMFLNILQNLQESINANSFLIKLQVWGLWLWHSCLHVNFAKYLRTPFSQDTYGQLLLTSVQYEIAINSKLKTSGIKAIRHYIHVLRHFPQISFKIYEYFSELFRFGSTKRYWKIYNYQGK